MGRYPTGSETQSDTALGEEFWLVRPMYFTTRHRSEDGGGAQRLLRRLDGIVHLPYGLASAEPMTHWAELPILSGGMTHVVLGMDVHLIRCVWRAHRQ
ncbi:AQJ64_40280 family protein [Streptomyces sp. NPDC001815]|uniref:AQJ64_40280 family protein n=1 Tax=Streptomyces sp. NPDC001815 TaxID=3154526 RepID=UPI003320D645